MRLFSRQTPERASQALRSLGFGLVQRFLKRFSREAVD